MCVTLSLTHFGAMDLSFRKWREVENNAQYDESYQLQLDRLLHCLKERLERTIFWRIGQICHKSDLDAETVSGKMISSTFFWSIESFRRGENAEGYLQYARSFSKDADDRANSKLIKGT